MVRSIILLDVDLVWALLVDMSLLCTFMLQHTVMARPVIKVLYNKLGLSIVERSVYNLTASLALQLLIQHWVALRDPVWRINTVEHNACWWMFAISHGYCWATIYLGSLTMDLSELLGIKQLANALVVLSSTTEVGEIEVRISVGGLHHSKCSLLVTLMARHRSRGLALLERWVYTISWNSDDKDQPMVYYYLNGWDDPLTLKSSELQRLISHQRHPSFVSFFFIFWVHPYMSVDRLIMAVIMTLYMVCAWKVDDIDFEYQERQFQRKEIELSHVH
uniref:Nuclear envelope membrane protein n=1 Tax=Timema shepardi TaxID=629360 RepID=A0A7R9AUC9_TIMSH|nr:unnamed protein product [Timema shepardi]